MKRNLLSFSFFLFFASILSAQYETRRNSLTIIYLEEPKGVGKFFQKNVPSEYRKSYNWNRIPIQSLKSGGDSLESAAQELTTAGVGKQLMEYWWLRQPDGWFRLDTVKKRGVYDATPQELSECSPQIRACKILEDNGLKLIEKSYILFMVPRNLKSQKEIYDEADRQARQKGSELVKRTMRGYEGKLDCYLLQLDYENSIKGEFYEKMWMYEDDSPEVKAQKKAAFDQFRFKLKPVQVIKAKTVFGKETLSGTESTDSKNPRSDEQLLEDWAEKAVKSVLSQLGEVIPNTFQLTGIRPLKAFIGSKEGGYLDKLYVVKERKERSDGTLKRYKRKGYIRMKKVSENQSNVSANTQPSTFYKVGGFSFLRPGMYISKQREIGFSVHALGTIPTMEEGSAIRDYGIGAEGNLSRFLGLIDVRKFPHALKIGVNFTFQNDERSIQTNRVIPVTLSRLSFYLRKDFHFLGIFHAGLWGGYGIDEVSEQNGKGNNVRKINTDIVPLGSELGLNIVPRFVQIFALGEYAIPVGPVKLNGTKQNGLNWFTLYPDRKGIVLRGGLRFNF